MLGNITQKAVLASRDPVLQIAHTVDLEGRFLFSEKELDKVLDAFVDRFGYVADSGADRALALLRLAAVPGNASLDEVLRYELIQVRRSLASGFHNIAL